MSLLQNIVSFIEDSFAKETCNFQAPTNRSHLIAKSERTALLSGFGNTF